MATRWMTGTAWAEVAPRIAPLAAHFPAPEAFEAWREGLAEGFVRETGAFLAIGPEAGLLLDGRNGQLTVLAAVGSVDEAGLREGMAALQARAKAITWAAET